MTTGDDTDDPTQAIMEATYRALCEHGYPAASIARIADEFEKSKSLLYYHYEDKEDLLEDFIHYLLDQLEAELSAIDAADPTTRLAEILDRLLPRSVDDEGIRFRRALFEIRSQAPYHSAYQEQFERSDELIVSEIIQTIEAGIETGEFRAVNARQTATFIYTTVCGAIERGVTLEDPSVIESGRRAIDDYVDSQLRSYA